MKVEYEELISLAKLYLLQEYGLREWKVCESESFEYFRVLEVKNSSIHKTTAENQFSPTEIHRFIDGSKRNPLDADPKNSFASDQVHDKKSMEKINSPVTDHKNSSITKPLLNSTQKKPQSTKVLTPDEIEVPTTPLSTDFSDIISFMQKRFPSISIQMTPPDDNEAKNSISLKKQKPAILILSFDKQIHPFLKNMEIAITQEFSLACVLSASKIENENAWEEILKQDQLKLMIASGVHLYSMQNLMRYYHEVPKKAHYFLGKIPLLLLTDLSSYLKEPKLKPALWRQIYQFLNAS